MDICVRLQIRRVEWRDGFLKIIKQLICYGCVYAIQISAGGMTRSNFSVFCGGAAKLRLRCRVEFGSDGKNKCKLQWVGRNRLLLCTVRNMQIESCA